MRAGLCVVTAGSCALSYDTVPTAAGGAGDPTYRSTQALTSGRLSSPCSCEMAEAAAPSCVKPLAPAPTSEYTTTRPSPQLYSRHVSCPPALVE
jgi:hypothetical protein